MRMTWYRRLLRILPAAMREEYGDEMCRVVEEHWYGVRARTGMAGRVRFWRRQVLAVVVAAITQRVRRDREHGGARWMRATGAERSGWVEGLWQDLRHSVRSFVKQPAFAGITVLTLALGIGASTTIFSAVHAVLFRELPYDDAEKIVVVFQTDTESGERSAGVSAANVRDLSEHAGRFEAVAVAEPWSLDLQLDGRTESLRTWTVSEGFFDAIGSPPALGRAFTRDEYVAGNEKVVVLSHRSWSGRFGGDPRIVGKTLNLDGEPYTVVGVLAPAFRFPDRAEAWIPRPPRDRDPVSRSADYMTGVARLASGATMAQAQAEVDRVALSLARLYPQTNALTGFRLVPLREHLFGDVRAPLFVLFAAVGFVLLIACANVAGLMLARGTQRQREYALRNALGAGTGRLMLHVAMESFVLAAAGCALGVALTFGGVRLIQSLGPDHLPRIDELRVDTVVLAFAALVAGLSAFLSGVVPSLRLSRPDLRAALTESSRGNTTGRGGRAVRNHLVVTEVAAAVVLLIGAGLLLKSFARLMNEELGFEPADRIAVQVFAYNYRDAAARAAFVNESIQNLEAIPGVRRVALTTSVPGANDASIASIEINVPFTVEGRAAPPSGQEPIAAISQVSSGYFDVLEIAIVAGRDFDDRDHVDAPPVIMINEALARRHFAEREAVGEKLVVEFGRPVVAREVVGVVRDVRPLGHESEPRPEVYFPLTQVGSGSLTFVIQTAPGLAAPTAHVMNAIWAVNPSQAIWGAATLESLLAEWLVERRFNLVLLSAFALIALVLATVGIYALISFSVEQRLGELGIRRALGGQRSDLLGMVLRDGASLAAAGIVLGLLAALALTRFIQAMLFGVATLDPTVFIGLAIAVLLVTSTAALIPAFRATRVDPMVALRNE